MTFSCRQCEWTGLIPALLFKNMANGNRHLGAYCPECDTWITWIQQTAKWLEEQRKQHVV